MAGKLTVSTAAISVVISIDERRYPFLERVDALISVDNTTPDTTFKVIPEAFPPLVEIRIDGEGNLGHSGKGDLGPKTGKALIGCAISQRLRYVSHSITDDKSFRLVDIEMYDKATATTVISDLSLSHSVPVLRSSSTIRNDSTEGRKVVHQVSSLVIGGLSKTEKWWHDYTVSSAFNTWFREAQWKESSLPDVGLDDFGFSGLGPKYDSKAYHSLSNRSTFSTQGHLPMGMLKRKDDKDLWLWQVENSGAWRSDVGDCGNSLYLATTGPQGSDHDWRVSLGPSESVTSCWTALVHLEGDQKIEGNKLDTAFGYLTDYRRTITKPHKDHDNMPIIFNDYMNCLMGDPTEEKILALLDPVAKSGAEYFVIDAGWYADDSNWWDDVGLWEPSKRRFPSGFDKLLSTFRDKGLTPGLWLEPEVIGARCSLADTLPHEAFLQRDGTRFLEQRRYHLDYRHPAVRERMSKVVDGLIKDYGVGYFKFDYNIEHVLGTDIDCFSAGEGQAGHSRAYLAWVNDLLDRHPGLVIENCSSGGMRMDYGMLSVHTLQSTSDQQDPVHYAVIAAAIPTAVTPEQSAVWAYPQTEWSDEINALTVANTLLGRIHLSGRLDQMSPAQLDIVYEGMGVYKDIRSDLKTATPFWPLGLPGWHDEWLALGMKCQDSKSQRCYLMVWRRGGSKSCHLPINILQGKQNVGIKLLYPTKMHAKGQWNSDTSGVEVEVPGEICARLFQLDCTP